MLMENDEKRPDYLIIFFSMVLMIGVLIMAMCLLSGCSMTFSRDTDTKDLEHKHKTEFNVTTKF